jgi:hypothetical protein
MMADLPPAWWIVKDEFHGNKQFVAQVKARAKEHPAIFLDTYQKPSKYWFYSGDTAFGLNTPTYRRNNYNFWPIEDAFNGHPAYVFGMYDKSFFNDGFVLRSGEKNGGRYVPLYYSFSKVMITSVDAKSSVNGKVKISFTTHTPPGYLELFKKFPYDTASFYLAVYQKNKVSGYIPLGVKVGELDKVEKDISVDINLPEGTYQCKIAISSCLPGRPSLNSSRFTSHLSPH